MRRIVLSSRSLFDRSRIREVRGMLKPLARDMSRVFVTMEKDFASGGQIVSASDGFTSPRVPRERTFKSKVPAVLCQYYETWIPDRELASWHLSHVYLHLYERPQRNENLKQLVCLHAEPQLTLKQHETRVRAGPHLHIKVEAGRLKAMSASHIPLNYGDADAVLSSSEALRAALDNSITILDKEIMLRL